MSAVPRGVTISLAAFCVLYALLSFLFSLLLSFGVFLILGTAFVSLVSYFRIPPPSKNAVESVLGVDYHKLKVDEEEARALGTDPPKPSGLLMPIVAHRGACLDAPENSLSAFKLVKERGVHGVELDVSVTKDGVPIVFHDDVLDRVTQGSGKVSEMTFEEIKKLDLSSKFLFPEKFPNEKIPTLASAVDLCLELGLKIMIDIKDPHPSVAYAVLAEYRRRPELKKHALVSSFFPHMIYIVRSNDPEIVCSMALRPSFYAYRNFSMTDGPYKARYDTWWKHFGASLLDGLTDLGQFSFIPYFLGLSAILASQSVCDSSRLAHWKRQGLRVFIWTVNDPILKKYCLEYLKVPYLTDTLEV